jgi:hypothetical protein
MRNSTGAKHFGKIRKKKKIEKRKIRYLQN